MASTQPNTPLFANFPESSKRFRIKKRSGRSARTFKTFDEIRRLDGFRENNLVDQERYDALLGDYELSPMVRCCRKKGSGRICDTPHSFGYVTKLKDGTVSIVGHCCVENYFRDGDQLVSDIKRLEDDRARAKALTQVAHILSEKDARITYVGEVLRQLQELRKPIEELADAIGPMALTALKRMAKTRSHQIILQFEKDYEVEEEDDYGRTTRRKEVEKNRVPITVMSPEIFSEYVFDSIQQSADSVLNALDEAENVTSTMSSFKVENLTNRAHYDFTEKLDRLRGLSTRFWNWNLDFLVFLNGNIEDRARTASYLLKRKGKPHDHKAAKDWVRRMDDNLKKHQGDADRLVIL